MATATPAQFKEWVKVHRTKNTPPKEGQVFNAVDGRKIRFVYDSQQDPSCNLDIDTGPSSTTKVRSSNQTGVWCTEQQDHNGLRVIIVGAEKALYLQWKDNVTVAGIKINNVSRTKKSVLGELILDA